MTIEQSTLEDLCDFSDAEATETRLRAAALERGRVQNSSGHPDRAIPYLESAAAARVAPYLVVDALHMLAIADPSQDGAGRALELLEHVTDDRTLRWRVALHDDRGWSRLDAGDAAAALPEFEAALDAARRWGTEQQVRWAVEAVDECRAALP